MKRRIICFLLALCSHGLITQAQFNKTFIHTINGTSKSIAPTDIIDGGNGTTITIGHSWSEDYTVLRRLDFSGNIIQEKAYLLPLNTILTRIIRTPTDDIIAVGYIDRTEVVYAYKFDNALNLVWSRGYIDPTMYPHSSNGDFRDIVNIVKVANSNDDYIIVGISGAEPPYYSPPSPTPSWAFTAISAIRISGANGAMVWHNKYYHPLFVNAYDPPAPGVMWQRRELPSALAYGDNKYFIGGVAKSMLHTNTNIMGPYEERYMNFAMAIDENGNIVSGYKEFAIPGDPNNMINTNPPKSYSFHDGIFDAQTNEFIMSFTINGFRLANAVNETEIGILKLTSNLGYSDMKYYFDRSNPDHEAYRIKETDAHDGYIVACGVNQSLVYSPLVPALLKLNKNGTPQFYHRYNQNHGFHHSQGFLSNPAITPVTDGGIENYVIACTPIGVHTRVISTNTFGEACGFRVHDPKYLQPIDIIVNPIAYNASDDMTDAIIPMYPDDPIVMEITDCADARNPDSYKPSIIEDVAINTTKVYPTILGHETNNINIEANIETGSSILITISGMDGRTIYTNDAPLHAGKNSISCILPEMVSGIYMLRLDSDNTSLNQVIKIYKQ